jgi:hypothetical protein
MSAGTIEATKCHPSASSIVRRRACFDHGDDKIKFVWPDVPRTAFKKGGSHQYASAVVWAKERGMHAYATGYADAAKKLFATIDGTRRPPDLLIFPLGLLWRHCFELQLKQIIERGRRIAGNEGTFPKHHKLYELWNTARPLVAPLGPPDAPEIVNVTTIIGELQKIDPTGEGFRYPTLMSGDASLDGIPSVVDLEAFHEAMLAVSHFFDAVVEMMHQHYGELLEQERYHYDHHDDYDE